MFPINLKETLVAAIRENERPRDGLLHASGDLRGSLRHTQLYVAGAPTLESETVQAIRLMTGSLWHEWTVKALLSRGIAFMQEVRLNPWLPYGWGGTADWVFWAPEYRGFVLGDKKTIKGEGMRWVVREGAKEEHIWQTSLYWHALYDSGLPMVQGIGILYWPMNDTQDKHENVVPEVVEFDPLPRDKVFAVAEERTRSTIEYMESLAWKPQLGLAPTVPDEVWAQPEMFFLTDKLAPEQDRVQKTFWNASQQGFDVKLVPHWSAQFCAFPDALCGCSAQGTTKIGHYTLEGKYVPRKGYEDVWPMVEPTEAEYRKKQKAAKVEEKKGEDELRQQLEASVQAIGGNDD